MDVILLFFLGALIGKYLFPLHFQPVLEKLLMFFTLCLIFAMGVQLGQRANIFAELSSVGMESLLFFLLPTLGSIFVVYPFSRIVFPNLKKKEEK